MKTYVLTPGQADLLSGTYGSEFVNKNVIAVSIEAPVALSQVRIEKAMLEMAKSHPGLRSVLTAADSGRDSRQWVHAEEDSLACALFVREEARSELVADEMSLLVGQMASRFDVVAGITWGVIQLRTGSSEHLVFVFNHIVCDFLSASQFIRTFIRAYTHDGALPSSRDTYLQYLCGLEEAWTSPPVDEVLWWHDRPWASIPALPESQPQSAPIRRTPRVDVLHERDLATDKLTEGSLIQTVEQGLRDVTNLAVTRVDAAVHGRATRLERSAGGWVSHALPYIRDVSGQSSDFEDTRRCATSWPAAFRSVRSRTDLSMEHHLRAHAFVNFFGSSDPLQWTVEGFRMSPVQPAYQAPGRSSLTPIHLKVRKGHEKWTFVWSLAGEDVQSAVADHVIRTLTRRAA